MTLIESMMTDCVRLILTAESDGHMGHWNTWNEGGHFCAAVIKNAQQAVTEAEKPAVSEPYTVVVPAGTVLAFHDAFRRVSDGATFRVLGDVRDTQAPGQSSVQIAKVPAERWEPQ